MNDHLMNYNLSSDREVYVKGSDKEKIVSLLNKKLNILVFDSEISESYFLYLCDDIRVLINTQIQDDFISVFIKGTDEWSSDLQLARYFLSIPDVLIRCDPGIEYPHVSPYSNVFAEIDSEGERLVEWE